MTHHHSPWWMVAAGACAVAATVAPAGPASAADAFFIKLNDRSNVIDLGDSISYTVLTKNNVASSDYLVALSWEDATFVSFDAPPGWHVNLPPSVTATAISMFYTPTGDSSITEAWIGMARFTLVVEPTDAGTFAADATVFTAPANFSDLEHTKVRATL